MNRHISKWWTVFTMLAALALVAAGCGGDSESATAAETTTSTTEAEAATTTEAETTTTTEAETTTTTSEAKTTTTTEAETTTTAEVDTGTGDALVEVATIDQGAEPRFELRYSFPEGQTESVINLIEQSISQEVGGQILNEVETSQVMAMDVTATAIEGNYLLTSVVTESRASDDSDPLLKAALDPELAKLVGLTQLTVMDPQGRVLSVEVEGLDSLDPLVASATEQVANTQVAFPFPTEPVGIGAVWEVTQPISLNGLEINQSTTATLTAVDEAGNFSVSTTVTQEIPPDSVLETEGISLDVVSWKSTGAGTWDGSTTSMIATATSQVSSVQVFSFAGDEMTQTIDATVTFVPG